MHKILRCQVLADPGSWFSKDTKRIKLEPCKVSPYAIVSLPEAAFHNHQEVYKAAEAELRRERSWICAVVLKPSNRTTQRMELDNVVSRESSTPVAYVFFSAAVSDALSARLMFNDLTSHYTGKVAETDSMVYWPLTDEDIKSVTKNIPTTSKASKPFKLRDGEPYGNSKGVGLLSSLLPRYPLPVPHELKSFTVMFSPTDEQAVATVVGSTIMACVMALSAGFSAPLSANVNGINGIETKAASNRQIGWISEHVAQVSGKSGNGVFHVYESVKVPVIGDDDKSSTPLTAQAAAEIYHKRKVRVLARPITSGIGREIGGIVGAAASKSTSLTSDHHMSETTNGNSYTTLSTPEFIWRDHIEVAVRRHSNSLHQDAATVFPPFASQVSLLSPSPSPSPSSSTTTNTAVLTDRISLLHTFAARVELDVYQESGTVRVTLILSTVSPHIVRDGLCERIVRQVESSGFSAGREELAW
ncbi:hypothetical protein HDU76_002011 [Blyttiomyces sp. JEL0837]|nr:hypothetical protein HDU76_002011 [Blyttiomyces sp. JEL0837]